MATSDRPETKKTRGKASHGDGVPAGDVETPPVDPRRDPKTGRILPGHTINAGGIPAKALELRRLALANAPAALERAIEWVSSEDEETAERGIRIVLERALGKNVSAKDLPADAAPLPDLDVSPAKLVELATRALARNLQRLEQRAASGEPLTSDESAQLAESARALAVIAKEDREQSKADDLAKMPPEQLSALVLSMLSVEALQKELAARLAAPSQGEAKP